MVWMCGILTISNKKKLKKRSTNIMHHSFKKFFIKKYSIIPVKTG